ncbi:MAG: aminodeoxychorismate synthase component I [Lagierella massiliensis]|nr:aminodeoxychorismate synthase component I [Lagierella massiliensis]
MKNNKVYEYPDAYFRYVDRAVILDHKDDMLYILSYDDDKVFHEEMKEVLSKKVKNTEESIEELGLPKIKLRKNKKEYISLIEECKEYIVKGESYEICLTNRMDIDRHLDPVKYYKILRSISPAPYSALLNFDEISIASSSMERFLKINKDGIMETKPIKGTIKRGKDDIEDKRLMDSLKEEIKTKAENLMIVDLLRNDLGKVAKVGTVNVPKLMEVETYSTLHQLVTTIKGELEDEYDIIDALKVVFPGGSMTGAPKKRTLEIIDKLEDFPRGVYSGAIGYISNNNTLDFNIVIRTAVIEKNRTTLGVGGAIINLSDSKEEFEEILLKAKGVLRSVNKYYGLLESEDIKIEGI